MFFRTLLIALCLVLITETGFAEERITDFLVSIDVSETGDFVVTETISVKVEGKTIRRGIFRDLPRYLKDGDYNIPQRYQFQSVRRNGEDEPYAVESVGNAKRVLIGDADVFLPHGYHTYEIKYFIENQIRRTPDFDEVYWNVTGNYWRYKIDRASAGVMVPDRATLQLADVFTGALGKKNKDATFAQMGEVYRFDSTRVFDPKEGMSIVLRFDKGVIGGPTKSASRFLWWVKNGAMLIFSFSSLGILALYYSAWNKVGRDPAKHPVFARYKLPADYSPAAVSHIHYKSVRGTKPMVATLMGLAIKKYIEIETDKKRTTLTNIGGTVSLNPEEQSLYRALFNGKHKTLVLDGKPNANFHNDVKRFERKLTTRYGNPYFKWNGGYMALGIILSIIAVMFALSQIFGYMQPVFWIFIATLIGMNILFMFLLPAPTKKGQAMMAEIEGFRLYLKTAEKLRLNAYEVGGDRPPPMSIEHYEAMLPYAIALDVEEPWSDYFEGVMPEEAENYNPHWSHGHTGNHRSFSKLTDSMVSNISSGVSSAAPQSSSSSGSGGGGGFSGGGGGGGGGGGW